MQTDEKTLTLREFLSDLDQYAERIPLDVLCEKMNQLSLSLADVKAFEHYGKECYQRNLMHTGPAYQALILCWANGQRSTIHDHVGSSCGVYVIKGTATETIFNWSDNKMIYPTATHHHEEGYVCASQDEDMHQVSNLQAGEAPLVTLHIYSPALLTMNCYSLTSSEVRQFNDPVQQMYHHGAGI